MSEKEICIFIEDGYCKNSLSKVVVCSDPCKECDFYGGKKEALKLITDLTEQIRELKKRAETSLSWMVKDMKWRHNQTKLNQEGFDGEYSPELLEAIKFLEAVKGGL